MPILLQAALEGRPGAVYVDIPSNILMAPAQGQLPSAPSTIPLPFAHRPSADQSSVDKAASLLRNAARCRSLHYTKLVLHGRWHR